MRVVNTNTLQLEEFPDSESHLEENGYAILSHRWGAKEDEISYSDLLSSSADIDAKASVNKFKGFCRLARSMGHRYAWMDTCCINRANSSEFNEAVNSMYRWYEGSKICLVYLEDVPRLPMLESDWFTRGWTLQELIAPKHVSFFDQQWRFLGTKSDALLLCRLSSKTRVPRDVLTHCTRPSAYSVAQRMSWAAERVTTRVEDQAYCLMGLFNIYMPMIYGEREAAFLRLQQHILQRVKDESMFAWDLGAVDGAKPFHGLFAPSPKAYINCSSIRVVKGSRGIAELNGQLSIYPKIAPYNMETYYALLCCEDIASAPGKRSIGILISRTEAENEFVRVTGLNNVSVFRLDSSTLENCWEQQVLVPAQPIEPPRGVFYGYWLRIMQPPGYHRARVTVTSNAPNQEPYYVAQTLQSAGLTGVVRINHTGSILKSLLWHNFWTISWIEFGFDEQFNPIIRLTTNFSTSIKIWEFENYNANRKYNERHDFMTNALFTTDMKFTESSPTIKEWLKSLQFTLFVDKTSGLGPMIIPYLDLKITVKQEPYPVYDMSDSVTLHDSQLWSPHPQKVWIVEITEAKSMSGAERFIWLLGKLPLVGVYLLARVTKRVLRSHVSYALLLIAAAVGAICAPAIHKARSGPKSG